MFRWWWFGPAVTETELAKELETMHAAGIGGVEIQPVYPMALDDEAKGIMNLPYLSQPFLDAVRFADTRARSLGMRVDITLGSGWPYGGPHTTVENVSTHLKTVAIPVSGATSNLPQLQPGEHAIAAFEGRGNLKTFDPATAKQLTLSPGASSVQTSGTSGNSALVFLASPTKQMVKRPSAGADGYVLDHLSRAAIDQHLNEVATPLLSAFGTTPPFSVFSDSLEVYGADWTANLPAEFQRRRGYDLIPHLPELLRGGSPQAEAVRHDWGVTLSDLVRENYLLPITEFAHKHNSKFRSQTYGIPPVTLSDEATPDLPEGEGPQWNAFSFTRWASSASHLYGRSVTSAETWTWLHSPVFRATPLDMKVEADRMFLEGVNQIIGHGWPYSPPAAGEPGWSLYAAAVFNAHNPWFPVMPDVIQYLHRASWLLRQGVPANDIAVLLPEDDAQASFTPGHASITDEMKRHITPALMSAILDAGYNLDYIDAATIDKLGLHHPVLVIPPTDRIPLSTYKKIQAYATGGGKVIAIGKQPSLAPGLKEQGSSSEIAQISRQIFGGAPPRASFVPTEAELGAALHKALPPDLILPAGAQGISFLHRKLPASDIYFVVNTSNQPVSTQIGFRSRRPVTETWDLQTGMVSDAGKSPIRADLAP